MSRLPFMSHVARLRGDVTAAEVVVEVTLGAQINVLVFDADQQVARESIGVGECRQVPDLPAIPLSPAQ
jgi:hypothetical protein